MTYFDLKPHFTDEGGEMNFRTTMLIGCLAAAIFPATAAAELRFCNRTNGKVWVAIAYVEKDPPGTTTNGHAGVTAEGWFSFEPGQCSKVSDIHVGNHETYYYAHGDRGVWEGSSMLCIPSKGFTKSVRFIFQGEGCPAGNNLKGFRRMSANTRGFTMNLNP
jgi:uncharacterized membrane protein